MSYSLARQHVDLKLLRVVTPPSERLFRGHLETVLKQQVIQS